MNLPSMLVVSASGAAPLCEALSEVINSSYLKTVLQKLPITEEDLHSGCRAFPDGPPPTPCVVLIVLVGDKLHLAEKIFRLVKARLNDPPAILVTDEDEPEKIYSLLRAGFSEYLTPPFKPAADLPRIWRFLDRPQATPGPPPEIKRHLEKAHLIGRSEVFLAEARKIPVIAGCDSSVLILGETGTGKEVCARAIHYCSPRAGKPFIPVNCGAIPADLIENELFGHERGAYTGAFAPQHGLVREADGGTIFLDEVDSLPPPAQVKILRFIQEREYRPLGGGRERKADVKLMAATNTFLETKVTEGSFRRDLYYRLKVIQLTIPPLRERREDIMLLARHFLCKYAGKFGKDCREFSAGAEQKMLSYVWPGNVRELEHVVERAVVFSADRVVRSTALSLPDCPAENAHESFKEAKNRVIEQFEKAYIERALADHGGNISRAAEAARKDRRTFFELIRKHHIDPRPYKKTAAGDGM